jgi:hypothetical protein
MPGMAYLLIASLALADTELGSEVPVAQIEYSPGKDLRLTYFLGGTTTRLGFSRNPDKSRVVTWVPVDDAFKVYSENDREYVSRVDGGAFTEVALSIEPT